MTKMLDHPAVSPATRAELRHVANTLGDAVATASPAYLSLKPSGSVVAPVEIFLSPEALARITSLIMRDARNSRDEMTTGQAADFLGVSRPYLVKLLDAGKMPFRHVGHFRRVNRADVERFEQEEQARRKAGLNELAALTQEIGLEY